MRNVLVSLSAALLALNAALAPVSAPAEDTPAAKPVPVVIGSKVRLYLRSGDTLNGKGIPIEERIQKVDEIFAKYLGARKGRVTAKKVGDRTHLYLNGEFVLAVTPADVKAGAYKSVDTLAAQWRKSLQKAFDESKGEK